MKLKIEIDENLTEPEVVIRCARADEEVLSIQRRVLEHSEQPSRLVLYRDGVEYYLPAEHILFFETQDEQVYAHTARDVYRIKRRLYEL
ncbi:MAG: LytTR family transcriptional regulator, partial [Oscillospiraceae bacterium]|nr:LytTR family transcriptional regulator [Oscillospiraceae bacterium]